MGHTYFKSQEMSMRYDSVINARTEGAWPSVSISVKFEAEEHLTYRPMAPVRENRRAPQHTRTKSSFSPFLSALLGPPPSASVGPLG